MHTGSTNDAPAYETCSLRELCEQLPFPYHWVGDNAYTLTELLDVGEDGRLVNNAWRDGVRPANWEAASGGVRTGNTLRDSILRTVTVNSYEHYRSNHVV